MDKLSWIFELRDRVTPVAKDMLAAIRATRGELDHMKQSVDVTADSGGASKSIAKFTIVLVALAKVALLLGGIGFFQEFPKILGRFRKGGAAAGFQELGDSMRRMGGNFLERIGFTAGGVKRVAAVGAGVLGIAAAVGVVVGGVFIIGKAFGAVLSVVGRVAGAVGDLARRFGESVLQARLLHDQTVRALSTITGSRSSGVRITAEIRELAAFMGSDLQETARSITSLMSGGFNQAEAFRVFQAVRDLQIIDPDANSENITRAIRQIRSKGVLQMEELQGQLADAGVSVGDVLERIGANLGISAAQVRQRISAGRITADMGIEGILGSINARAGGGPTGQLGRDATMGLGGLLERLKQAPTHLFAAIAASSDKAFGSVTSWLRDINELINPDSADFQSMVRVLSGGFEVLVEVLRTAWDVGKAFFEGLLGGLDTGGADGVVDLADKLRDGLIWLRDPATLRYVRKFGDAFKWIVGAAAVLTLGLVALATAVTAFIAGIVAGFVGFWTLIVAIVGGIAAFIGMLVVKIVSFGAELGELGPRAYQWGSDIVTGLIAGMQAQLAALRATATSIATTITGTVSSALDMGSPSREMEWLGRMTGAGFQRGLDASMPSLSTPGLAPSLAGGPGGNAGARGGNISIQITVQGGGDPDSLAESIGRLLVPQLEAALEGLAIEAGTA